MASLDVAVVGAGPAGAAAAACLARHRRVALIERRAGSPARIGESLPAAARHLLCEMGVWDTFARAGHAPCYANRSVWGGPEPVEQDALRDPDGHGWHLNRARFEADLRDEAAARGVTLFCPAQIAGLARDSGRWTMTIGHGGDRITVDAPVLIDAGGRTSGLMRPFGVRRTGRDRLVCGWVHGVAEPDAQRITYIEAEESGWWYTAALPDGRRILAFHTDADLPAAADARNAASLLARARRLPQLTGVLAGARLDASGTSGFCAAHSAECVPIAGEGWLTVGDAALAFDPLSSQGLFHALYTAIAAARTVEAALDGDSAALVRYAGEIARIRDAYRDHLATYYGAERRWPTSAFWARRHGLGPHEPLDRQQCDRP
jgi:2-polyprenyl-6-methoxyphenol hydroxylase-like FAD-dependent oxidoreductase